MSIQARFGAILCCLFQVALAQAPTAQLSSPPAATKLETFVGKKGLVSVKGFSRIGRIANGAKGEIIIFATEFRDPNKPNDGLYGISIDVRGLSQNGTGYQTKRSFIQLDDIDSLIQGLDYISKISRSVTTLADFEATYRSGTLTSMVYSDSNSGGGWYFHYRATMLAHFLICRTRREFQLRCSRLSVSLKAPVR